MAVGSESSGSGTGVGSGIVGVVGIGKLESSRVEYDCVHILAENWLCISREQVACNLDLDHVEAGQATA